MGHIRVGRLPKTQRWKQVISLLNSANSTSGDIAAEAAKAAKDFFVQKGDDPGLVFSYWLITQITYRARKEAFEGELKKIGLDVSKVNSAFDFLSVVASFVSNQIKSKGGTFPISEFAQLSLRELLTETIGQESQTLFGTTLEDIRIACRKYSTPDRFAKLARLFFSKVLNRTLQFFVSKESPNNVGIGEKFETIFDLSDFNHALKAYCYQSAKIVEKFAGGWYSKRNWQGEISENDAKGFVSIAINKLRSEIAREEEYREDED